MAIPFDITVKKENGVDIVSVSGALDAATLEEFTKVMGPIMNGVLPKVILDCHRLEYMNSRVIGQLSQYHRMAMVKGGRLFLMALSTRLQRSFERLRMKDTLFLCDSKEVAMAKFDD